MRTHRHWFVRHQLYHRHLVAPLALDKLMSCSLSKSTRATATTTCERHRVCMSRVFTWRASRHDTRRSRNGHVDIAIINARVGVVPQREYSTGRGHANNAARNHKPDLHTSYGLTTRGVTVWHVELWNITSQAQQKVYIPQTYIPESSLLGSRTHGSGI